MVFLVLLCLEDQGPVSQNRLRCEFVLRGSQHYVCPLHLQTLYDRISKIPLLRPLDIKTTSLFRPVFPSLK